MLNDLLINKNNKQINDLTCEVWWSYLQCAEDINNNDNKIKHAILVKIHTTYISVSILLPEILWM